MRWFRWIFLCLICVNTGSQAFSQTTTVDTSAIRLLDLDREAIIPDTLKPWIPWVLRHHQKDFCPFRFDDPNNKSCAWPSHIAIDTSSNGGRFTLEWTMFAPDFVILPGDEKAWPLEVKVNDKAVPVVQKDGWPQLWLGKGSHKITGKFQWKSPPESIHIPEQSGILRLTVNGKLIKFVDINEDGRLWLQQEKQEEQQQDDTDKAGEVFEINVQRHIIDEIPFTVETRMDIYVAGKNREITLDGALLPGFVAASISSGLPVRLDKDNKIRLKLRPGKWDVRITGRYHDAAMNELKIPPHTAPWPDEEIWVFEARPFLRLAQIEGVTAIDPKQTQIPPEWHQFPTYRMTSAETFKIVEQQRGHIEPRPPALNLVRELWLDFSGDGYSLKDRLDGQLNAVTRLVVTPPISLGRVVLNDKDQLITKLDTNAGEGIEAQPGPLRLVGDSRINSSNKTLPAVGWNLDVDNVSMLLHLPPGYRLFTVFGADQVSNTWLEFWNLVHIFLVALIVFAIAALFDKRLAIVAAATLILCYPETNFPRYTWFYLLTAYAALRYIPQTPIKRIGAAVLTIALFFIGIDGVFFAVNQIQKALYPVLERSGPVSGYSTETAMNKADRRDAEIEQIAADKNFADTGRGGGEGMTEPTPPALASAPAEMRKERKNVQKPSLGAAGHTNYFNLSRASNKKYLDVDPKANVQTGPGLPSWEWTQSSIQWQGAVKKDHTFILAVIPPWLNFLLGFLRVGCLGALFYFLVRCSFNLMRKELEPWDFLQKVRPTSLTLLVLAVGLVSTTPSAKAATSKPSEPGQLQELEEWLLRPSPCGTSCVSYDRLSIETTGQNLTLAFGVHAYAQTAVPLPGTGSQWFVESVSLDGQSNVAMHRDPAGTLWLVVKPGTHTVRMQGSLPNRDTVQLSLPMHPFLINYTGNSWTLEGVSDDRIEDTLVLRRRNASERTIERDAQDLAQQPLAPFLQIERRLTLGLTWTVTTVVTRSSQGNTSIQARIPLLNGEAVTTAGLRVEQGHVLLNMSPGVNEITWESVLEQQPTVILNATKTAEWNERWLLESSPIWHVESAGIPTIEDPFIGDASLRVWRPWPGETLTLTIARPTPVEGQTKTIDQVTLHTKPGLRILNATLNLRIRASLGGQHTVKLDENAEVTSLKVDEQEIPIRQDKGKVTFPIRPGTQTVTISWRENRGLSAIFATPKVDLQSPAVNVSINNEMSEQRWILLTGGPRLGPVVLYWGFTLTLLVVSFFLGKLEWLPIKNYEWLLLALGLSQGSSTMVMTVLAFVLILGLRSRVNLPKNSVLFNIIQVAFVIWAISVIMILSSLLWDGFLHLPQMRLSGNGSSVHQLNWFMDRIENQLPHAWVFSLSIIWYRILTLLWALWLARFALRLLPFAWKTFAREGILRKIEFPKRRQAGIQPSPPPEKKG